MKTKELVKLGVPKGDAVHAARRGIVAGRGDGVPVARLREMILGVVADPSARLDHPYFAALARVLHRPSPPPPRTSSAPWEQWGTDVEPQSIRQIQNACRLPVAVRGALMPDAHPGYGLPIGGVLATRNAVIPYAVGVDIACRVKMSVLDIDVAELDRNQDRFRKAIDVETRFGVGAEFRKRREHPVLDADWRVTPVTRSLKNKAWAQLGTSGSGNHFVEFGELVVGEHHGLDLAPGRYLALLSHSGSRGAGATVASHFSKLAKRLHPELPNDFQNLAGLDLDTDEGWSYWMAMELMGQYAAANHACIHRHVAAHLGARVRLDLENHHNFAWRETHDGEEVIVHRKGATPAGKGVLGIIPGSMATPTYVARGLGSAASLETASHGAGRVMSRSQAKRTLDWRTASEGVRASGVTLMSAGLDEVPAVYKDIHAVMAAQADLVEPLALFHPRLVKMAPGSERPED